MQKKNNINIPPWAQGFGLVALIIGGGYLIYRNRKDAEEQAQIKPEQNLISQSNAEAVAYQQSGMKPTYQPSVYTSSANTIATALEGCDSFSSELTAIAEVIKVVKNPLDWAMLIKAFGTRKIADCGYGYTYYSLPTLLKDQLDTSGIYSFSATDTNGYSDSGAVLNSIDILKKYFTKLNITL